MEQVVRDRAEFGPRVRDLVDLKAVRSKRAGEEG
jgi:hypothetical protein